MTRRTWTLFLALSVIWGIPYLLIKVADEAFTPATLVFIRTGIGALVLVPVAAARGGLRPVLSKWRPVLVFTVVEVAIPWLMLAQAERRLASSLSGLLVAAVPFVGLGLARISGTRHDTTGAQLLGMTVGLGGVAVLVGFDFHGAETGSFLAMAVVILGYAIGPQVVSRHLSDVPSIGVVAVALTVSAAAYSPFAATEMPAHLPTARALLSIVTLGLVCTALAFVLFFGLIAEVGPVKATVITYVNPAIAVLLGVVLLGESFTIWTGVGFVMVLGGSVVATNGTRRWRRDPAYTGSVPDVGSDPRLGGLGSGPAIVDPSSTPAGRGPAGGASG